jgi:hypothetical protein
MSVTFRATHLRPLPTQSKFSLLGHGPEGSLLVDNDRLTVRHAHATRGGISPPNTRPTSGEGVVQRFIVQENIHRYELLLKQENGRERAALLEALLAEEKAKLGSLTRRDQGVGT